SNDTPTPPAHRQDDHAIPTTTDRRFADFPTESFTPGLSHKIPGNYLAAGAVRLVLAGVIEDLEDRKLCTDAIGIELSVCRLRADLPVIHQRLTRRHENESEALRWHLARAGELAGILEQAAVDDFTVDATTRPVDEVATEVTRKAGWV
ncbi:hypothetical protein, partial [Streptomyces sp. NPDC002785]|uniref:hypothetical protein n=1 Tax=Streptomyces sp. NPDC002785 TaxID=3154543 RepID=UPI00331713BB